jgi:hypothetical protein
MVVSLAVAEQNLGPKANQEKVLCKLKTLFGRATF